ncbi:MAG: hypothetical protein AVDCRST_MAG45-1183, partial [uncultured Solirubrobacterales bacterium]
RRGAAAGDPGQPGGLHAPQGHRRSAHRARRGGAL